MKLFPLLLFVTQLYLPTTKSANVKIDGTIDLGQNWEFEYTPEPLTQFTTDTDFFRADTTTQKTTQGTNQAQTSPAETKGHRKHKQKNNLTTSHLRHTEYEKTTAMSNSPRVTYLTESTVTEATKRKHSHKHRSHVGVNASKVVISLSFPTTRFTTTTTTKLTTSPSKVLMQVLRELGMNISNYKIPELSSVVPFAAKTDSEPPRVTELYFNHQHARGRSKADLYDKPHLVKDDERIQAFTIFVFRQSLGIFDNLKSKVNSSRIKNKVNFIARTYRDKFADFVNETQNQKILTRLGRQKVILNTIDTSNRILRRLLNYFTLDMKKKGSLREKRIVAEDWKVEVDNEEQQEYVYACQSMNICRSKNSFSTFVSEMLTIVLSTDDAKLMQSVNALTEVVKNTKNNLDKNMQQRIKGAVELIERQHPMVLRPMIHMFRNMLMNKHKPLVVANTYNSAKTVNKTVAAMDFMDMLDDRIPATADTQKEWNNMKSNLEDWAKGGKSNIMDIMQTFVSHVLKKGFGGVSSPEISKSFHDKLKIMLRN